MTRLEGVLLGALVEVLGVAKPPAPNVEPICHKGITTAAQCGRCGPLLRAQALVERTLKRQRKKDPKRRVGGRRRSFAERHDPLDQTLGEARKQEELTRYDDDGRGGTRVGERRQRARTFHVVDADSSARDVAIARADLVGFFGDVLDKHHGGR